MPKYTLSPNAIEDLKGIWDYTASQWGISQADKYLAQIETRFDYLADNPKHGRKRDEIRVDFRSYLEGKHVIFYREKLDKTGIEIIGVLHQRQDVERYFKIVE